MKNQGLCRTHKEYEHIPSVHVLPVDEEELHYWQSSRRNVPRASAPDPGAPNLGVVRGLSCGERWRDLRDSIFPRLDKRDLDQAVFVEAQFVTVPVWYATDRNHQPNMSLTKRYGADRSIVAGHTVMNYGCMNVTIPRIHSIGRLEKPKWYRFEFTEDPDRHVVLQSLTELTQEDWLHGVQERVGGEGGEVDVADTSRDILIFVHGYKTSWSAAAKRAAQFAHDLEFRGMTMLYSWPSRGDLLSYTVDESASAWSAPHFSEAPGSSCAD